MQLEGDGRIAVLAVDEALLRETGCEADDLEGVVNLPLAAGDVKAVILLKEAGTGLRVSLRSKDEIDVRRVAVSFGRRRASQRRGADHRRSHTRRAAAARGRGGRGDCGVASGVSTSQAAAGILIVDKPAGPTSHDIVAVARRALACRKVGHLGTLDPLATGVLPLVVGRATRLASLFDGASKQYDAVIRLGLATDTCDIGGAVVGGSDAGRERGAPGPAPPPEAVAKAAAGFVGSCLQRPPAVSAKRIAGVRAYELARRERPGRARPGSRHRRRAGCALDRGAPGCGAASPARPASTYGRWRGTSASRWAAGRAWKRCGANGTAGSRWPTPCRWPPSSRRKHPRRPRLVPLDGLLPELPGVVVTERGARRAAHGNPLDPADFAPAGGAGAPLPGARIRLLDPAGRLLAIADPQTGGALHPRIVLV